MLWQGQFPDVIKILQVPPGLSQAAGLRVPALILLAVAHGNSHNFSDAERALNDAQSLCIGSTSFECVDLIVARGLVASQRKDGDLAEQLYRQSLALARAHDYKFLAATSLLNLGDEYLERAHYDEAIDWSQSASDAAKAEGAKVLELVANANLGWAYYRLGDSERALKIFKETEKAAAECGDVSDQENQLINIGYVYMDDHKFDQARELLQKALLLAQQIRDQQDIYNALRALARLSLRAEDPEPASKYVDQALHVARESKDHVGELEGKLLQGRIAALLGHSQQAESSYREVEADNSVPDFLKWEAQHSLARLFENSSQASADLNYRAAIATFEAARQSVRHEDSQISFPANAIEIYGDYIQFLVSHRRSNDALRWADYSRARSLTQGFESLPAKMSGDAPPLRPNEIARAVNGTILFYWLGEKQSYLWAVSPKTTQLITLPPGREIDVVARRYRNALIGPQDVSAETDGSWLYRTLVAPAQGILTNDARVFVVPDGSLNGLNFETFLVSDPSPHFWIEDATVLNASSLRLLNASFPSRRKPSRTLLIGNSISPNDKFPELSHAADQMKNVARHFTANALLVLDRGRATPKAYFASGPEHFALIHFVAHGIASRLSPLDSAIVLSRSGPEDDSFKLYARDIIRHPLHADLVTISACYGAGERFYSGEGLVGLSWAFHRAGARNVIAALWDAADVSSEKLMSAFYQELDRGARIDAALRTAKLALLRDKDLHNPFYWAPFQLYTQGRMNR
ncbi:MAG TPA: CHAT domain-containing protein [Terriglobales bacterium]|nr:CHAT domain-containing protein [Terriglobales bacterium]